MPDEPESLILQHLRAIRSDLGAVRETQAEHTSRLGRLELSVAETKRSLADVDVQLAEHSVRLDRINSRLDRIDQRLGLVEA